jgi:HEAT repeat protein
MRPGQIDLRAQLSLGRHALDPARAVEVAAWIRDHPRQAGRLIELLWDDDAGVANRAADALERVSIEPSPALSRVIAGYKEALLGLLPDARFIKLRWNLAFVMGRLPLTLAEARRAASVLKTFLDDRSSIVKTAALQGLADLIRHDPASLPEVLDLLRIQGRSGTPAMRARSRNLIRRLDPPARSAPRRRPAASQDQQPVTIETRVRSVELLKKALPDAGGRARGRKKR